MPNDLAQVRIGIVVSKRISKHAVVRNHIKRLLGEAIRAFLPELSGGWDVILSARSSILTADLPTLRQDVGTLLRRARLLAPAQTPEARILLYAKVETGEIYWTCTYSLVPAHAVGGPALIVSVYSLMFTIWI